MALVAAGQMAIGIGRRQFMSALGGAAVALPLVARAQQTRGTRTVGVLMAIAESDADSQTRIAAFRQSFEELGWTDGQNVRIEYRWAAGKMDVIEQYAHEIVALNPDVILANGTPVVAALQGITSSIPIVCALVNDPVGLGFVKSLARPGGNITGFTFIDPELISKWIELLKDATPDLSRAALLFNPVTAPSEVSEPNRNRAPAGPNHFGGNACRHPCGAGVRYRHIRAKAGRLADDRTGRVHDRPHRRNCAACGKKPTPRDLGLSTIRRCRWSHVLRAGHGGHLPSGSLLRGPYP
jgi:hypothetical protein